MSFTMVPAMAEGHTWTVTGQQIEAVSSGAEEEGRGRSVRETEKRSKEGASVVVDEQWVMTTWLSAVCAADG